MSWAFRASDSAFNEESSSPVVVNKPAGTVEDDILIAGGNKDFPAAFGTPGAGFTIREDIADADQRHALWSKVAGASEPSTYSFAKPNGDGTISLGAFSGGDTADHYDVSSQNQQGASASHIALAVTPTNNDALLVAIYGTDVQSAQAITWTEPTEMTKREDISTASDIWSSHSMHEEILIGGGGSSTGTRTATASSSQQYGAILAAFNVLSGVAHALVGAVTVVHQADVDEALQTPDCDEILAPDSLLEQSRLSGAVTDIDEPVRTPDANFLERI